MTDEQQTPPDRLDTLQLDGLRIKLARLAGSVELLDLHIANLRDTRAAICTEYDTTSALLQAQTEIGNILLAENTPLLAVGGM